MISGKTTLIAHLGYPTFAFKAPLIYNPYFERAGIDAVVVPMGVRAEDYAPLLRPLFAIANLRGALVTMPHKVTTVALLDGFLGGLLATLDPTRDLVVVAADHGNFEDQSQSDHTRNPALVTVWGARHAEVAASLRSLTDIAPALAAWLALG